METKPPTRNSDNQKEDFKYNPLGVYASGYEEHPNYKKESTERKRFIGKMMIDIFTLIFAGAVAYFTYNIMRDTGKQAEQTERSVNASINASNKSIALAQRTVEIADSNMRIDNRAWVGFVNIRKDDEPLSVNTVVVVTFQNYGKTPADSCIVEVTYSYEHKMNIRTLPKRNIKTFPSLIAVSPSQPIFSSVKLSEIIDNLRPIHIDSINQGLAFLFVYGIATYKDLFDQHDTTTFCYYYDKRIKDFAAYNRFNKMK